ncbi:hypothetical protein LQZ18_01690 [Lachnospiraceae bacterium ZAX-1]
MPAAVNGALTVLGKALMAKIEMGGGEIPLNITRIVSANGTSNDPISQTDVVGQMQEFAITGCSTSGAETTISTSLTNIGVMSGYYLFQIGFFAEDPDLGEILFRISQFSEANYIPAENERSCTYQPKFKFTSGNAANVTVNIDPSGFATQSQLEELGVQANAYTDEQIAETVAASQTWLNAVATFADLPIITDTSKTWLCRVLENNNVYQCVAGQASWSLYSNDTDYIDPEELADALGTAQDGGLAITSITEDATKFNTGSSVLGAWVRNIVDKVNGIITALGTKANDSNSSATITESTAKITNNRIAGVAEWIQTFCNRINGIITELGKKQDIYDYTVMQNKYDGLTLPSVWPSGQTLMFSNAQTNKFNGQNYCTVITIKSFSVATTSCVQYIYPYNVEFPVTYRYALQGTDAWLAWRSIANADNPIFTGSISMGRLAGSTVGEYSVAVGKENRATGAYSHAEGYGTSATGAYSHTEGHNAQATGNSSHAEGLDTIALNDACHSEGYLTTSGGTASHSEGAHTSSFAYQHAGGHYNDSTLALPSTSSGTGTGTSFVLGNGTSSAVSNAFRVTDNGQCFAKMAYSATGADYAEYFEWDDGNPNNEDRRGIFVTMVGRRIKPAGRGDYILGIVSANPCILGNADECYSGQFLFDDFGEYIYETSMVDEPYIDEDGEQATRQIESTHYKLNPDYDPDRPYTPRAERKEWEAVGMMGVLTCRHDGTAVVDEYVECSADGVATHAETRTLDSYRVIEEIDSELCRVLVK